MIVWTATVNLTEQIGTIVTYDTGQTDADGRCKYCVRVHGLGDEKAFWVWHNQMNTWDHLLYEITRALVTGEWADMTEDREHE